jgi:hypothetical protein
VLIFCLFVWDSLACYGGVEAKETSTRWSAALGGAATTFGRGFRIVWSGDNMLWDRRP